MKRLSYTIVLAVYTFTSAAFGGLEYKREPLPDEENAWTYWNNALEYLSLPQEDHIKETLRTAYDLDMDGPDPGKEESDQWEQLEQIAKKQSNIFGKMIVADLVPTLTELNKRSVKARTKVNLTRAHLGIRLFEKK